MLRRRSQETYNDVNWLRSNRDKFRGEVNEPLILCSNMVDLAQANYMENSINMGGPTAFFFRDDGDMNTFLDCGGRRCLQSRSPPGRASLMKYGFISYLKEMVTAPDSVMAFMCHNYGFHRIPVFKAEVERFNDQLIHEEGLTKFFVGEKYQTVSGSMYSSAKTTMTKEVVGNSTMAVFMDTVSEAQLKQEKDERIVVVILISRSSPGTLRRDKKKHSPSQLVILFQITILTDKTMDRLNPLFDQRVLLDPYW